MLNQDRQQARVTMIPCCGTEFWIEDKKQTYSLKQDFYVLNSLENIS